MMAESPSEIRVEAASPDRWADLARLAGDRGFYSGCWCMWWRVTSQEWSDRHGDGLRSELKALVDEGVQPGLLAFAGDKPIGWVAVAARSEYPRLDRSPKLKPVDEKPVWSITCFYIDRHHRRRGVAQELLSAAVEFARSRGAEVIEAYPIDISGLKSPASASLFSGVLSMFEEAGFREVARREGRPIVRLIP